MGSEEESGKDWSELEEEAARGELKIVYLGRMWQFALLCFVCTAPNASCRAVYLR